MRSVLLDPCQWCYERPAYEWDDPLQQHLSRAQQLAGKFLASRAVGCTDSNALMDQISILRIFFVLC